MSSIPRLIAFYLPQYHPIPENDSWWGKGFTEWHNVARATPLFPGHYQPHLPADLGFYDLRLPEARQAQADLAREYGLHGFCYYHYWFNGYRLLNKPFDEVLASGQPDFPFCLCWANENWTRAWDGLERDILIQQHYTVEDDRQHLRWLATAFRDPRYIRVNGRPMFIVYRISLLPNPAQTAAVWREEAWKLGVGELHLCTVESLRDDRLDPRRIGFDATIEFQPDWLSLGRPARLLKDNNKVYDYADMADRMQLRAAPAYRRYACVMPGWDNTPRRRKDSFIFTGSTPEIYQRWLTAVLERATSTSTDDNLVFINAWNEWAEGAHLEPDQKWGRAYLEATRKALTDLRKHRAVAPVQVVTTEMVPARVPRLSVCVPTYNGAKFLREALNSIFNQTFTDYELIVVDDCSTDETETIVRSLQDKRLRFVRNPSRLGLVGNWNRCIELARASYICIFHQDDRMALSNLATKVDVLDQHPSVGMVYSNARQIGPEGEVISEYWYYPPVPADNGVHPGAEYFDKLIAGVNIVCCPSVVVRAECYQKLGLFDHRLPFTADWEMWLRIALFYDIAYVTEGLIEYRRHPGNATLSFAGARDMQEALQAKLIVLEKFPERIPNVRMLRHKVLQDYRRQAFDAALEAYRRSDLQLARSYVQMAISWSTNPEHQRVIGEPTHSDLLELIDRLWQLEPPPKSEYPVLETANSQLPIRYQPVFQQVVSELGVRDIADRLAVRKLLLAIAIKLSYRPAFRWLQRLEPLARRLLANRLVRL